MDKNNFSDKPETNNKPLKKSLKEKLFIKSLKPRMPKMNGMKIAYALAILLAIGGALSARLTATKTIDELNATFPQEEYTLPTPTLAYTQNTEAEEPDFEVRQNLTDVPDTRATTEAPIEISEIETTQEVVEYAMPFTDSFVLPLGTEINKEYSPVTPVYNATMGDWRTHPGIDFAGESGAQVKAISAGTVLKIYDDPLYGTIIEIDHGNGLIGKYCGINKDTIEIKKDSRVDAGDLIGYLGDIPCEKDDISHLHFEVVYKGKNADPMEIMGK